MTPDSGDQLLAAALDAWDRSNVALINLLGLIPHDALGARAMEGSPTIAAMFTHLHHERMVSVLENAPESAVVVPPVEWNDERDAARIADMLRDSGARVREAVKARIDGDRPLDRDFAHPVQLLSFLIFHDGYHHGQIKLALKAGGWLLADDDVGERVWDVWRAR